MTALQWTFDIFLVLALAGVAGSILKSRDLFKAVVLFIAFGLLMALAWVRLEAPDIALAEAAIGAGLIGVLLLDALRFIRRFAKIQTSEDDDEARTNIGRH
jgi:energy-converting hydrogenase B subunit D